MSTEKMSHPPRESRRAGRNVDFSTSDVTLSNVRNLKPGALLVNHRYSSYQPGCCSLYYVFVGIALALLTRREATVFAAAPLQFDLKVLSADLDDSDIPVINGDNVVWIGHIGADRQVYRYNISTGVRSILPSIDPLPDSPVIDGTYVAWE